MRAQVGTLLLRPPVHTGQHSFLQYMSLVSRLMSHVSCLLSHVAPFELLKGQQVVQNIHRSVAGNVDVRDQIEDVGGQGVGGERRRGGAGGVGGVDAAFGAAGRVSP